jgi:hypothetical protein
MSRTDKTNPWWHGRKWEPDHALGCPNRPAHGYSSHHRGFGFRECDLPEQPPRRKLTPPRYRERGCTWEPFAPHPYKLPGSKLWARGRYVSEISRAMEGGYRTAWLVTRQRLLQSPGHTQDIDVINPNHRHFALWDRW